jgi:hypothetical protein
MSFRKVLRLTLATASVTLAGSALFQRVIGSNGRLRVLDVIPFAVCFLVLCSVLLTKKTNNAARS